ncbi:hypothetical protein [Anoxynatronum buryatiense]|uniref:Uncharacterized protein n=1 Tax=Anoxynatronum buryatiense TaxID=489973 RepID=A0AA45WTE1_9CLOT|nr:hypothetical protein [Anoxynatronum buryatiense]SMP41879.1 hypothetical protein SAMN06296020_101555 [Anoxynatronum buryatiense]
MSSLKTMKAWAVKVNSIDEVPEVFRGTIVDLLEGNTTFPHMVYAPKNSQTGKPSVDTVMAATLDQVMFCMQEGNGIRTLIYDFAELQAIQIGTVLLQSWIRFFGNTTSGYKDTKLYYDTVMEELFLPVVENARLKALGLSEQGTEPDAGVLGQLMEESMKFLNYGKQSLLPGQRVRSMVYQPRAKGTTTSEETNETAPHLTLLTSEELILIQETKKDTSATQKYSGIWTYIPLHQITTTMLEESNDDGWEKLTIQLKEQKPVTILFDAANRLEIQTLAAQLPQV